MNRRSFLLGSIATFVAAPAAAKAIVLPIQSAIAAPPSIVNVLDYGAVPDGLSNCFDAFRRAMLAVSNGGTVFVPSGIYHIGPELVLPCDKSIHILGDANFGTHLKTVVTGGPATYEEAGSKYILENLHMDESPEI